MCKPLCMQIIFYMQYSIERLILSNLFISHPSSPHNVVKIAVAWVYLEDTNFLTSHANMENLHDIFCNFLNNGRRVMISLIFSIRILLLWVAQSHIFEMSGSINLNKWINILLMWISFLCIYLFWYRMMDELILQKIFLWNYPPSVLQKAIFLMG